MNIAYSGLDPLSQSVQVKSSQAAMLEVALTSGVYKMDAFKVTSQLEGNAASISRQKAADAIMNVIAMDTFGNVPDGNVGQFMKRLPGVHVMTAKEMSARLTPRSCCSVGSATTRHHMPMPPTVLSVTLATSRHHE